MGAWAGGRDGRVGHSRTGGTRRGRGDTMGGGGVWEPGTREHIFGSNQPLIFGKATNQAMPDI